jgi:hypothetical protein
MSYTFDGKLANQSPWRKMNGKVGCAKCNKQLDPPVTLSLDSADNKKQWAVYSYVDTKFYIYETLSGIAVTYCSKYCRDKHNHRFS